MEIQPLIIISYSWFINLPFPTLDCFASSLNSLCPSYISYYYDYESLMQDFFYCPDFPWASFTVWANPPYQSDILLSTVQSFISRKLDGYLCVPYKPDEPYFKIALTYASAYLLLPRHSAIFSPAYTKYLSFVGPTPWPVTIFIFSKTSSFSDPYIQFDFLTSSIWYPKLGVSSALYPLHPTSFPIINSKSSPSAPLLNYRHPFPTSNSNNIRSKRNYIRILLNKIPPLLNLDLLFTSLIQTISTHPSLTSHLSSYFCTSTYSLDLFYFPRHKQKLVRTLSPILQTPVLTHCSILWSDILNTTHLLLPLKIQSLIKTGLNPHFIYLSFLRQHL